MIERISAHMSNMSKCKFKCPIIILSPFMTTQFKLKLLQMSTGSQVEAMSYLYIVMMMWKS